jgi:hypothetical protein
VSGPGVREFELADVSANIPFTVDPIYLEAPDVLRSFMDIPGEGRVIRAVSVGTRENVHYTYDMDNSSIIHVWRGKFLDTTPMWHDRGDGSSRPRGMITVVDGTSPPVQPLSTAWKSDTSGLAFKTNGYRTEEDRMIFLYSMGNTSLEDHIKPLENGQGISRTLQAANAPNLYVRLGHGQKIIRVSKGLFKIQGTGQYYVETDPSVAAEIRLTSNGDMELVAPLGTSLTYSILF